MSSVSKSGRHRWTEGEEARVKAATVTAVRTKGRLDGPEIRRLFNHLATAEDDYTLDEEKDEQRMLQKIRRMRKNSEDFRNEWDKALEEHNDENMGDTSQESGEDGEDNEKKEDDEEDDDDGDEEVHSGSVRASARQRGAGSDISSAPEPSSSPDHMDRRAYTHVCRTLYHRR